MDAFQEGYHIQGIHPELVAAMDESKERYSFFGDHSVATAPFGASNLVASGPEGGEAIRQMPQTFPGVAAVLPRFEGLVGAASKRGWRAGVSGWRFGLARSCSGQHERH